MINNDKINYLFNTDYYYSFVYNLNNIIKYYNKYVYPNKYYIYKPRFFLKLITIYYYRYLKYILQSILIYFSLKIKLCKSISIKLRYRRLYHYYYYIFIKKFNKVDIIEYKTFEDLLLNLLD